MLQKKINQEITKIINVMLARGEKISKGNMLVLDLYKGFLFFDSSKGWLYEGMSTLSDPNELTGDVVRSAQILNYTTGKTRKGNYKLHEDSSIQDLKKLYDVILKGE